MQVHRAELRSRAGVPRTWVRALALSAIVFSVLNLIERALPLSNLLALVFAAGSTYIPLVALCGLVLSVRARDTRLSTLSLFMVVVTLAFQGHWYYFGYTADVGRHANIRVLSANLRKGQADASTFVGLAKESADVIVVLELTAEEAGRFSQAGIGGTFPYSVLFPASGAEGMGLWSRYPLTPVSPTRLRHAGIVAARLQVPGTRFNPMVAGVHIISPVAADTDSFNQWKIGISAIGAELKHFADMARSGAVVVSGDFNSTPDMRDFRELLSNGYRDAVEQTGAGFAPTFPSNVWFPPLLTIDHVLTRQAAAASIRSIEVPGSDHRALLATVEVPRG